MHAETFSTSEALSFGWNTFKRNIGASIGLSAATLAVMFLLNGLGQASQDYATLSLGFSLLTQLAQAFVAFLFIRFALAVHDARLLTTRELLPDAMTFLNYLAVSILYGLLVAAGFVLLVIPGIYLAVRYGLVGFLVADRRTDVLAAFRMSSELTRGLRWKLFLFGLVLFLVNLAGAIAFGIGLLITLPVTAFASTLVYRRLAERSAHERVMIGPPSAMPA